ncbi:YaiI/YqxD family protein [Salisediminibacterium halotolerans]|uniref:YaiI/YqxD family protein n=1 Tax=Salisediminibacterium halotolerans TaxID=517425 RepID=UPI001FE4030B|nr:DUF188 domain-containing protein [Salisediminibacterium halotolerans]
MFLLSNEELKQKMKVLIDGDACPVVPDILAIASHYGISVVIVSSYAHKRNQPWPDFVTERIVDPDNEAADTRIFTETQQGDVVVTDDMGLASLVLAKGASVLTGRGEEMTDWNIQFQLDKRAHQAKERRAGKKTKGPKAYLAEDRAEFRRNFEKKLSS